VRRGQQLHARADLAVGADRDRHHVERHEVEVDERAITDAHGAVLAEERRPHDHTLADVPQHPAQQRLSLRPNVRPRAVEVSEHRLDPAELGRALTIAGDVQLAAQHPVAHLTHRPS
jgi:hypothetical protein